MVLPTTYRIEYVSGRILRQYSSHLMPPVSMIGASVKVRPFAEILRAEIAIWFEAVRVAGVRFK